jgi:hypothetical protein
MLASFFREGVVVDRDVCPCCRTGPATGPDGSVYVVWRRIFEGGVRDIAIARSTDGGAIHVAWDDRREARENRQVHLARVERGRLVEPVTLRGSTPDLALAGRRRVLTWHHGETVQLRMVGE